MVTKDEFLPPYAEEEAGVVTGVESVGVRVSEDGWGGGVVAGMVVAMGEFVVTSVDPASITPVDEEEEEDAVTAERTRRGERTFCARDVCTHGCKGE